MWHTSQLVGFNILPKDIEQLEKSPLMLGSNIWAASLTLVDVINQHPGMAHGIYVIT